MNFFKKIPFLFLIVFLWPVHSAYAENPISKFDSDTKNIPIQVHGDSVEYFNEDQKVIGTGHVLIDYDDIHLTADKMTVYMATKTAVAEGHVKLVQKGSVFTGEHAEFNFGTKVGNVSKMSGSMEPGFYGKAQSIEKVSDKQYRATDSYVTTCCGDNPFYKIQAHQVDFFPGDKIVIRNAILYVHNIPMLFIPYYVQPFIDMDRFPVQIVPGKNSQWGPFVLSKWRYHLIDNPKFQSKGNVLLDYRVKRGFAGGVENFYNGDKTGRGALRVYGMDDRHAPQDVDNGRYRVQWRHQAKIGEATTLTTEVNKLSDTTVIKDFFFRDEYARDAFPDNYVSLITAKPEYTLSFLERHRLDDLFNVVERNPEVRFDTHNHQFAETPFYFRQEVQASNLSRASAGTDESRDTMRFDFNHTLAYAGRIGDISVTPRVGTRQTIYSRNVSGSDTGFVRGVIDPGLDLSTRFYKTYDTYIKAFGLDYNQIRHIFQPNVSYNYRPDPTVLRTKLEQFDALDAIDKQNIVHFDFENKFQTKEHDNAGVLQTREIARVIPFFDTDLHTGRATNVGMRAELRPYTWLGLEGDSTLDAESKHVDTANGDIYFQKGPARLALGQRYVRDESSQMTGEIGWKLTPDVELKLYERYEFETSDSKEFEFTLSKTFECIIVDFTYNHRQGDTFFFVFRLKSFPKASFSMSQSYDRPKASSERI